MVSSVEGRIKIEKILKSKFPNLSDEEITKKAENIYELGSFLVSLAKKKVSKTAKPHDNSE